MSKANLGKILSDEQKEKLSKSHKGKSKSEKHKENLAKALKIKAKKDNKYKQFLADIGKSAHLSENFVRGSRSKKAKLKEADIIEIKRLYSNKEFTHQKIANMYNVSRESITKILKGETWRHVKDLNG